MSDLSQTQSQARERPVLVTILAILAGIAAVIAAIHCDPVLRDLPIRCWSLWVYSPLLQLLGMR